MRHTRHSAAGRWPHCTYGWHMTGGARARGHHLWLHGDVEQALQHEAQARQAAGLPGEDFIFIIRAGCCFCFGQLTAACSSVGGNGKLATLHVPYDLPQHRSCRGWGGADNSQREAPKHACAPQGQAPLQILLKAPLQRTHPCLQSAAGWHALLLHALHASKPWLVHVHRKLWPLVLLASEPESVWSFSCFAAHGMLRAQAGPPDHKERILAWWGPAAAAALGFTAACPCHPGQLPDRQHRCLAALQHVPCL